MYSFFSFTDVRISVAVERANIDDVLLHQTERRDTTVLRLQRRMESRLDNIRNICNSSTLEHFRTVFRVKSYSELLMTVNGSGVCMCKVPKASSTFFGKVFLLLQGEFQPETVKRLSGFEIHGRIFAHYGIPCDLNTQPLFFVTRNPYSRLFSGYIDKIFVPKFWKLALSLHHYENRKHINVRDIYKFMQDETEKGNCYVNDVSFDVFLRYVVTTKSMDAHFTPVSMMCDPCKRNYSAIIKQENFKEETMFTLDKFGVKPEIQAEIAPLLDEELVEQSVQNLFDTVRKILVSLRKDLGCKNPDFIYLRVWQAIQILGYVDASEPFPAKVFSQGLKSAYEQLKLHNITFLNSTQRARQRYEYLRLAYKSVDPKIIKRVQQLFQLDFLMFGYDDRPPA